MTVPWRVSARHFALESRMARPLGASPPFPSTPDTKARSTVPHCGARASAGSCAMRDALVQVLASDTIRYAQVWEDHLLLERGLRIEPKDHVVSVTSGGDNVLALLLQEPRRITAID